MQTRHAYILALLTAFAVGCSKPAPAPAPTPAPTPVASAAPIATPPPAPAGVHITAVDLGRAIGADKHVTEATTTFKTTDTIYVSVLTDGTAASAAMKARFTFGEGQLVSESTQTIAPTGPSATEFHIEKADGWPKGTYKVEVTLDAEGAKTAEFKVE